MSKRLTTKDVPELEGWLSIPAAARVMNLSRQYVHRLAASGIFSTRHRIGTTYIVSTWEAMDLAGQYEKLDNEQEM